MKRYGKFFCGVVALLLLGSVGMASAEGTVYNQVHEIMDWGPATTMLIVDLGESVAATAISPDAFTVEVKRYDARLAEPLLAEGQRTVLAAYVSDAEGNKVDNGQYVTLLMDYGASDPLSSPMNYEFMSGYNAWIECAYTITQQEEIGGVSGIVATVLGETFVPVMDKFSLDGSIDYTDETFGDITLKYADYKPAGAYAGANLPLIIWLHGAGEGGTDPSLAISANKACDFASDELQAYFGGEAYVLAPQAPTVWMDDGSENPYGPKTEATSKFSRALMNLIETYVADNPGIDTSRIYLGGCSNGGYMTVVTALANPDYFAAAFPVCEAVQDSLISDEALAAIVDLPIWFVHAAEDTVVPAPVTSLATYDRLVKLGAKNVHLSYPKAVVDLSGWNVTEDGEPLTYMGHWSWIYVYNNDLSTEIDGETVTLMEWLAAQSK